MSDKTQKIYAAMIDGAQAGLTDDGLFIYVIERCPKATSKKVVRASLLALSDPDLKDKNILGVIYALAIKHRLEPLSKEDIKAVKNTLKSEPNAKPGSKSRKDSGDAVQTPDSTQLNVGP